MKRKCQRRQKEEEYDKDNQIRAQRDWQDMISYLKEHEKEENSEKEETPNEEQKDIDNT